jgi:DNA-binding response OmpR family regulator
MERVARRIIVVDDDMATCCMLRYVLQDEGFEVLAFDSAQSVSDAVRAGAELLVLDVSIGPVNGFALLAQLQLIPKCPPAIFLSAHEESSSRLRAFELGALDYMVKPVDVGELVARVRVAVNRSTRAVDISAQRHGAVPVHVDRRPISVTRLDGKVVRLSPHEARLLQILMDSVGHVVSRDELLERVWGADYEGEAGAIDVGIRRLRKKIELSPDRPTLIRTVRGMGYAISADSAFAMMMRSA